VGGHSRLSLHLNHCYRVRTSEAGSTTETADLSTKLSTAISTGSLAHRAAGGGCAICCCRCRINSVGRPAPDRPGHAAGATGESSTPPRGDAVSRRQRHADRELSGTADVVTRLTSEYRPRLIDPGLWLQLPRAGEPASRACSPPYASKVQVLSSEVGMPVSAGRGPKSQVRSSRFGARVRSSEVRGPGSDIRSPGGRCSAARHRGDLPCCAGTDIRSICLKTPASMFSLAA